MYMLFDASDVASEQHNARGTRCARPRRLPITEHCLPVRLYSVPFFYVVGVQGYQGW